jgi:catechol 2,3-dioxygenase-like lactoylglutathione lyase family enzyme
MPVFKYDHVHLVCADPVKAAAWYEKVLCATIKEVGRYPDGGGRVELDLAGTRFLIRAPRNANQSAEDNPRGRRGLEHFGVTVENLNDAVAYIKSKGIKFYLEPYVSMPSGHNVAFIMGPDNVLIELVEGK